MNCFYCKYGYLEASIDSCFGWCTIISGKWKPKGMEQFYEGCSKLIKEGTK